MAAQVVNYVLIPFEGNINPGDPQGLKIYPQTTKDIDKEYDRLNFSISNAKEIIDHFLSLATKYNRRRLALMVDTSAGANEIFQQVEQVHIADMNHQAHV